MCNNSRFLIIIFVIKIIILFLIPIYLSYTYFRKQINKKIILVEIIFLVLLIILKISNNNCILNSTPAYIKNSNKEINYKNGYYNNDPNTVERIITNKIYKNSKGKKVYYFNNDEMPLRNKKIKCNGKEIYMKNYGNSITAVSILVSTVMERNIDPIEILNVVNKYNSFDCDLGINTRDLLEIVADNYNLNIKTINKDYLNNYISNGGVVISEVINNNSTVDIVCDQSSIIIYNVDGNNNLLILNPNDKKYDYICPEVSLGYGKVVKANTNNKSISISDLNNMSIYYTTLERR